MAPIYVRTQIIVRLGHYDMSKGNRVVVEGNPKLELTLSPNETNPHDLAVAEAIEQVAVSRRVLEQLGAIPRDAFLLARTPGVEAFLEPIEARHMAAAAAAVELLRWRTRSPSDHRAVSGRGLTAWSEDGSDWRPVPRDLRPTGTVRVVPKLPTGAVQRLSGMGSHEPVGHALLREAIGNATANPRSALIVAVAALEVGLKEAIADLDPVAGWLVEVGPSPPVDRILRELLPLLPARLTVEGRVLALPPKVVKRVADAVESRNKHVHVPGAKAFGRDDLTTLLEIVGDLLYVLDYYRGHGWALENIRSIELQSVMRPEWARGVDLSTMIQPPRSKMRPT